ncbi:AraC family transcriptional regulator [Saccharibacillus sp. CPCC 101409]|uniref:AraC family transcriptional regulator n=1 Tax=Saccharibacillus sp. CPCC 101409 TaxID=3058041 RepID=UPI0026720881|nr:AraC family transcriptional regulator [Saccharibacillus sp. CPCC 101409]MDO3409047.1 AraC family transcriptional regulator [Saccharibacillus sp. CPCC 101409]
MPEETEGFSYSVAPNPVYDDKGMLYVLFAGESQTLPEHRIGPKIYDYFLLHVVERGRGAFVHEGQTYELEAGDAFLIRPGRLVSYVSDRGAPWSYRWIAFAGPLAEDAVRTAGLTAQHPVFRPSGESDIPSLLNDTLEVFRSRRAGAHLASLGYLHLILAAAEDVVRGESAVPAADTAGSLAVKQMIRYMTDQYAHPVSIEDMCHSLGYNRAYLSRMFKKETGVAPVTYLLRLRIDKARGLLRERPDLSVQQIAASVGLTDPLYFSRQFQRLHGQAPTAYRESVLR